MDASATKFWEIARAILRYRETYPEAKDTLKGIAQCEEAQVPAWLGARRQRSPERR